MHTHMHVHSYMYTYVFVKLLNQKWMLIYLFFNITVYTWSIVLQADQKRWTEGEFMEEDM